MDEMRELCHILEQLTGALLTAMRAGDVATVMRLARGRQPYIDGFVERWQGLSDAERAEIEPCLLLVMSLDSDIIAAGQSWLHDVRQRLLQMRQGTMALKGYHAPFVALQDMIRRRH
jgi:hypothetical protein